MFRSLAGAAAAVGGTLYRSQPLINNQQHVIILAGPGGRYYDERLITSATDAFSAQGLKVTTIGDGVNGLKPKDMNLLYAKVKEDDNTLLMIIAEGSMSEEKNFGAPSAIACLHLDGENPTKTLAILKEIKAVRGGRPIDIVSVAGNEQLMADYVVGSKLHPDSFYVSLSPFENWFGGIQQVFDELKVTNYFKGEISAAKFLITYLALVKDLKRNTEPQTGGFRAIFEKVTDPWLPRFSINSSHRLYSYEQMKEVFRHQKQFGTPTASNGVSYESICRQQLTRFVRDSWCNINNIRVFNANIQTKEEVIDILRLMPIPAVGSTYTKFPLPPELDGMMPAIIISCSATNPRLRISWEPGDMPVPVEKAGVGLRQ